MRFLLDENQSPLLVDLLAAEGHDVAHVRDLGHAGASDESLFALLLASFLTPLACLGFGRA